MKYTFLKIIQNNIFHPAIIICIYFSSSFSSVAQTISSNAPGTTGIDIANTSMATTFPCDGKLYYLVEDNGIMKLVSVSNYTGSTPVSNFECTLPSSISVSSNSLGANPVDGYLYFLEKKSTGKTQVRRLDATCNTTSICPTDMIPFTNAGCFDHLGRYWVIDNDQLIGWDLNTCSKVKGPFNLPAGQSANDLIYNTQDCFFYSGNVKVDASGNATLLPGSGISGPGIAMGIDGKVYSIGGGNATSADLNRYDLPSTNGTYVGKVSPGTTGGTDAASFPCSNVTPDFTYVVSPPCTLPKTVTFTDNSTGLITSWLWEFGDGTTSTAQNPPPHVYSSAGSYTVKLTAGITTSCLTITSNSKSVTLTIPSNISVSSSSKTDVTCFGGNNGSASVTISGGTIPYTYAWSPSAGTGATVSGLSANTYTLTVTDGAGCTFTTTALIAQPADLTLTPAGSTLSCIGGSDGTVSITASGGTATYSYLWSVPGETGTTVSSLSAGTYSITVTDNNGCTKKATATVASPAPIVLTPSTTDATCGGSNGSATITVSGGSSPYSYLWSGGETAATVSSISGGSYTVTVTDNKSCTQTTAVVVNNSGAATLSLDSTAVTCNGGSNGSATVTVTGGTAPYTYSWNSMPAQTTATATNLPAGVYTIVVRDNVGCISSLPVNITEPAAIGIISSTTNVSCFGKNDGTATITTSGGSGIYTYTWSSGNSGTTTSILSAGTYTVTATDNVGCTGLTTLVITQPTVLASTPSSTNVSCSGGNNGSATVSVSGGTAPYTYSWSPNGETTAGISSLTAGNYTVIVSDSNGCTNSIPVVITQPPVIGLTTSKTNLACFGDNTGTVSVTASGGTSPYSYNWSPYNGTSSGMSGLPPNSYTITVTDNNGCSKTDAVTITEPPVIALVTPLTTTNVSCFGGNNGKAKLIASGGTMPYTYAWSPVTGSLDSISNLSAGTYTVTITDKNGCTENALATITEPSILITTPSTTNVSCFGGNNGSATVSVSGGTSPYSYSWSSAGQTTPSVSNLTAGSYTVVVSDANGCTQINTITITHPPLITLTPSTSNVSCFGGINGTATVSITGGTSPFIYTWSPSVGTGASLAGLSAGTYTLTVNDNNGCSKTTSVTITQPSAIVLSAPVSTNVSCFGGNNGTATVNPSGGTSPYAYLWTTSGGSGATASNLSAGTYTLTVTDNNGCTKTTTTIITQPADIVLTTSGSNVSCNGGSDGSASVSVSGGTGTYTYSWSPVPGGGATLSGIPAGTYKVTVTDNNGCTKTANTIITELAGVVAGFTPNPATGTAPLIVNFTNSSTGGITYNWFFGDGTTSTLVNPTYTYTKIGDYTVKLVVTGPGGCKDSITYVIKVVEETVICVPNVFTPNGDGINDVFDLCGKGMIVIDGYIYDRWGLLLYRWDTPKGGWDGRTSSGEQVPDGVYYYLIYARGSDGKDYTLKGFIQLLNSH